MMKRRIFPWMGLIVLFLSFGISQETLAQETYKVKRGDTLARIATKYSVSPKALREANHLNGNNLRDNQILTIPIASTQKTAQAKKPSAPQPAYYTVKKGDNIYSVAKKSGISVSDLKKANNLRSDSLKPGLKIRLAKLELKPGKKIAKSVGPDDLDEDEEVGLNDDSLGVGPLADAGKDIPTNAELMGKWQNPDERRLFVKVATAFLGAPYRWGGVNLSGLDCSAYVKKIYQLFDISLPRTAHEQANVGVRIAKNELTEGDLVFFNTKRLLGHVGIYIGDSKFVHASSGSSRVVKIDSLEEPYYNKRFATAVRLKGLDGEPL